MNPDRKRWIILLSGILANLCQGAAYASSVFAVPMMLHLNRTITGPDGKPAPDMAKWALAFSINLGMLPVGMLLSGKLADQKSSRLVVFVGGLLFGLGILLAGFTSSLAWLYLSFGVVVGIGSGAAYGAVVSTAVRWFPDYRGLASGLAVGALGFGPVIIAPVAERLMANAPAGVPPVLFAFRVLGVAFTIIIALSSIMMVAPPQGYAPAKFTPKAAARAAAGKHYVWTEMISTSRFWLLYILYAFGAFSGLMIISQAKPIAMQIQGAGLSADAVKAFATWVVMIIAIANATGRVVWASVSDWLGRTRSLMLMFLVTSIAMFLMTRFAGSREGIVPLVILIGACFGGYLGTFPALCADAFGSKFLALNYALLFSAFSLAAIAGPYVAGYVKNTRGNYVQAFYVAAVISALGFVLALIMSFSRKKAAV